MDPGPERPPVPPPSDAIVLFDGTDLSQWQMRDSTPAKWIVRAGYVEVAPGTGSMQTRRGFGDVQLHIEWATPNPPHGDSQERGNSGVFLMSHYEIQVLDGWHNITYADGYQGAVYGQTPPLVNASRPPGQWQTYDIVFHRPRFGPDGRLLYLSLRPRIVKLRPGDLLIFDGRETKAVVKNVYIATEEA